MSFATSAKNYYNGLVNKNATDLTYDNALIGKGGFTFSVLKSTSINLSSQINTKDNTKITPSPIKITLSGLISELNLTPPNDLFTYFNQFYDALDAKTSMVGSILGTKQSKTMRQIYSVGTKAKGWANEANRYVRFGTNAIKSIEQFFPNAATNSSVITRAYRTFLVLWKEGQSVTIVNSLDTFQDMAITNVTFTMDELKIGVMDMSVSLTQLEKKKPSTKSLNSIIAKAHSHTTVDTKIPL